MGVVMSCTVYILTFMLVCSILLLCDYYSVLLKNSRGMLPRRCGHFMSRPRALLVKARVPVMHMRRLVGHPRCVCTEAIMLEITYGRAPRLEPASVRRTQLSIVQCLREHVHCPQVRVQPSLLCAHLKM